MDVQSKALVIKTFPYQDNSLIARLYTRSNGMQAFLIRGIHSKKNLFSKSYFQSLLQLVLVYNYRANKDLQYLKEVRLDHPYENIYTNPLKASQLMFVSELLTKLLKTNESDPVLFDYISHKLYELDQMQPFSADFHLDFMLGLTKFMGFFPTYKMSPGNHFDLREGEFIYGKPSHNDYLGIEESRHLGCFIDSYNNKKYALTRHERQEILQIMLRYYQTHIPEFGHMRTVDVLKDLFD